MSIIRSRRNEFSCRTHVIVDVDKTEVNAIVHVDKPEVL